MFHGATEGIYSGETCDFEIEDEEGISEEERKNNGNRWRSTPSYHKLSVPSVRLEPSQNQVVGKDPEPLRPAITSSTQLQLRKVTSEVDPNLKTTSVEFETLNEDMVEHNSKNYYHSTQLDFVSDPSASDENSLTKNGVIVELEDNNLSENVIEIEYVGECGEFLTYTSSLPGQISEIQTTNVLNETLDQETDEVLILLINDLPNENAMNETLVQLFDCVVSPGSFNSDSSSPSKPQIKTQEICKKYICDICGKSCNYKSSIVRHRLIHRNIKLYECEICQKKFKLKEYLYAHKQTHYYTQYSCDYCTNIYSSKSSLNSHLKTHDKGHKKFQGLRASDLRD